MTYLLLPFPDGHTESPISDALNNAGFRNILITMPIIQTEAHGSWKIHPDDAAALSRRETLEFIRISPDLLR